MMAADYNKPVVTDNYAVLIAQLRDNIAAAQSLLNDLTGVTNIPTGAVRYDQTLNKFQSYNGSTFDDLVLSPAGGGTGITNWAKASTAEAEAGTANKYPDAAGVLAAIAANTDNINNFGLTEVFSGSVSSLDVSAYDEGVYIVRCSEAVSGVSFNILLNYHGFAFSSVAATSAAPFAIYHNIGMVKTAANILVAAADRTSSDYTSYPATITNLWRLQ